MLRHLNATPDSELMDDVDDMYDAMVRASEAGDDAEYRRLKAIHDYAFEHLKARGLIT